jgi:hypothetical protein
MRIQQILILLLLLPAILFSAPINMQQAERVAKNIYFERNYTNPNQNIENIQITDYVVEYTNDMRPLLYFFTINNEGYVIVSADDRAYPVLGYSFESVYNGKEEGSPAFMEWIDNYLKQMQAIIDNNYPATAEITTAWNHYLSEDPNDFIDYLSGTRAMEPLINTKWGQSGFYNDMCPSSSAGQSIVGCVAVAMAQVMGYYMHPAQGTGTQGYYHPTYGYLSANFGNTTYNWNGIQTSLSAPNDDLALILYHSGIAVYMNYGVNASGSMTEYTEDALEDHFDYNTTANCIDKSSYSNTVWKNTLVTQLDASKPMIYSGYGSGGHAFNCDGYQGTDHFHFNWGWNGSYDGYFYVTALNPGSENFTQGQQAVVNIVPNTTNFPVGCTGTKTLNTVYGMFEDGSGPLEDYQDNSNCSWLIQPSVPVDQINIEFIEMNTESSNDIITIYNGTSTSDPVIGTYTGATVPSIISVNNTAVLVNFTSNASTTDEGWLLQYNSRPTKFCNSMTSLTAASASFDDGSGSFEYANLSICRWLIEPSGMQEITLFFDAFDIHTSDYVRVYDAQNQTLLGEFKGSNTPSPVVCNSGSMQVMFVSDASVTASGFEAHYTSSNAIENNDFSSLEIYPNPATNLLWIEMQMDDFDTDIVVSIYDLCGRELQTESYSPVYSFKENIDISTFSQGVYILKIQQGDKNYHQKIIIQ